MKERKERKDDDDEGITVDSRQKLVKSGSDRFRWLRSSCAIKPSGAGSILSYLCPHSVSLSPLYYTQIPIIFSATPLHQAVHSSRKGRERKSLFAFERIS